MSRSSTSKATPFIVRPVPSYWPLPTTHYRTPVAPMIRGYLKHQKSLDEGLAQWSLAYSHQVEKDFERFSQAIKNGELPAVK